jgi:hypothetical protein
VVRRDVVLKSGVRQNAEDGGTNEQALIAPRWSAGHRRIVRKPSRNDKYGDVLLEVTDLTPSRHGISFRCSRARCRFRRSRGRRSDGRSRARFSGWTRPVGRDPVRGPAREVSVARDAIARASRLSGGQGGTGARPVVFHPGQYLLPFSRN